MLSIDINGFKILADPALNKKDGFFPQYEIDQLFITKKPKI